MSYRDEFHIIDEYTGYSYCGKIKPKGAAKYMEDLIGKDRRIARHFCKHCFQTAYHYVTSYFNHKAGIKEE